MKRVLTMGLVLAAAACSGGGAEGTADAAPPDALLGVDQTVVGFDGEHVFFGGGQDRRVVEVEVDFPAAGPQYERIALRFGLRCPSGRCDWWDRLGWLSIADGEQELEVLRFVTPYRLPGQWEIDVTDLRPLLTGRRSLRVFIDTWVGPGHQNGDGWLVDAAFEFHGGLPAREPLAVIPVWAPHARTYGDPAQPIAASANVEVPAEATSIAVRSFVTGHGQGNADNCAEFCDKQHWLELGGDRRARTVWRDDCPETAVPNQHGTWRYPRAGWCPGAPVHPWVEEVALDTGAGPLTIGYDVEAYENTCRPEAATCTGCTLGTGCDYDGGAHTPPSFYVSALVIAYR